MMCTGVGAGAGVRTQFTTEAESLGLAWLGLCKLLALNIRCVVVNLIFVFLLHSF